MPIVDIILSFCTHKTHLDRDNFWTCLIYHTIISVAIISAIFRENGEVRGMRLDHVQSLLALVCHKEYHNVVESTMNALTTLMHVCSYSKLNTR